MRELDGFVNVFEDEEEEEEGGSYKGGTPAKGPKGKEEGRKGVTFLPLASTWFLKVMFTWSKGQTVKGDYYACGGIRDSMTLF